MLSGDQLDPEVVVVVVGVIVVDAFPLLVVQRPLANDEWTQTETSYA